MKLDLACGNAPSPPGFRGVDIAPIPEVLNVDLSKYPWPFPPDSVEELRCAHFVEHVPDLVAFMNECWRILEPGGVFGIIHPHEFSTIAWQDPTHVRAVNEATWSYFSRRWRESEGLDHYNITADFEIDALTLIANEDYRDLTPEDLRTMSRKFNNYVDAVIVRLVKVT